MMSIRRIADGRISQARVAWPHNHYDHYAAGFSLLSADTGRLTCLGERCVRPARSSTMSKAFLLVSALLVGVAAFGLSSRTALAAEAESAAAARKACEQDAARQHYVGKQRSRFIRQCLANKDRAKAKAAARPEI